MAKIVALDARTTAWVRARFEEYYRQTALPGPDRIARREFAAFPFAAETLMRRHAAFASEEELRRFVREVVPRHIYYSTAYYRHPARPAMPQKEWLGADLIFDLDADHLRGAEALDYAGQLRLVQRRTRTLVEEFLLGDFGVDPEHLRIVFSGGRGYHVHVVEDRFLSLTSAERRELVDYLAGQGFDPASALLRRRERDPLAAGDRATTAGSSGIRAIGDPSAPGWRGRTARAILARLEAWSALPPGEAAEEIARTVQAAGQPPAEARRMARSAARHLVEEGGAARIVADPDHLLPKAALPDELLSAILRGLAIELQGETDAPVTTDIHRLIRLPGSLHGGTGLSVRPVPLDRLPSFDPLAEAVVSWPGSARVVYRAEASHAIAGEAIHARPGAEEELPTAAATFLVLRGEAELPPSPE
ncbi:MAG: DNA primase small subunit PriS [Thermoplasmata archaeon]